MGRQGHHCCLGGTSGDRGQWDKWKQSPACPFSMQLFLAAHTQLLFSFFCHQHVRGVKLKAITCKNLPLAPWLLPWRFKSLRRPKPLLLLYSRGAAELGRVQAAGHPSSHCGYSCKPSSSHKCQHPALCFPRKNSPSAIWESHSVHSEVFSPKQSHPKAQKVTTTQL